MENIRIITSKRCILLLLSICVSSLVSASWTPIISHYTPKNYAAGTQNWDIVEQSNGWIYIANNYGLLEYDGCHWRLYGIESGTAVRAITLGNNGDIYVGGTDEFGVFSPNDFGELEYKNLSSKLTDRYRRFGEVWRLQVVDGVLYVQTRHYIFICNSNGDIEVLDPGAIIYESLVWEGNLYVATSRDIYVYSGYRFHVLRDAEVLRGAVVCGILPYKEDYLLIATDFQGLYLYDGKTISRFTTEIDNYLSANQLYTVTMNENRMVFGTVRGGVVVTDMQGKNGEYITRSDGLQNNTVLSLLFDSQDYLWVGLDNGIDVVDYANPVYFYNNKKLDYGSGYCSTEYNGKMYLGTNQGLYVFSNNELSLIKGSQGQVWNISKVGTTLFCCHNRGLFIVDKSHSLHALDCSDGVWSIYALDESSAIVGSYAGFYYLFQDGRNWKLRYLNGFSETALNYTLDRNNNIWLLSSRGVECLAIDLDNFKITSKLIINQPLASRTYSLVRYNEEVYVTSEDYFGIANNGHIEIDTTIFNTFAGVHRYLHIGEDADKNRWFVYDGRVIVQPYDGINNLYGEKQVVLHSPLLIDGFCNVNYPKSGGAIIGGVDGFYHLGLPKQKQSDNNIYIRRIISLEESTNALLYGESYDNKQTECVKVSPHDRSLRIELCGQYAMNGELLFRTRLYPLEDNFTRWTSLSYWDFITLPTGGKYRLDIEMMEAETGKVYSRSLPIELVYPWYLSWWAKCFYIILSILILLNTIHLLYRKVQRSKARLADEKNAEIYQQQLRILQLENDKAKNDLRNKSQELSNFLLSEASRKEWNDEVLTDIRRIIDYINAERYTEARNKLQSLQGRLSRNGEKSIEWKRFEENFDIVNNQFISRLSKHYPWMSKQERRLCVYIHIGLSSKEIAPLLNISTRAVEMMRYRIRNKMQIVSSVSLKQHFNELQQMD